MKNVLLIFAVAVSAPLHGQPGPAEVLRLIDTYELVPGGQQPSAADMYPGEGMRILEGSYLRAFREEFLCIVPLVKGQKRSAFALVAYLDGAGEWQRSDWFELGFSHMEGKDVDGDGVEEIILEARYEGSRQTSTSFTLFSIIQNVKRELYAVEGFRLGESARMVARPGDLLSRTYDISFEDLDGNGEMEIAQRVAEEQYLPEEAGEEVPDEGGSDIRTVRTTSHYRLKKGVYVKDESGK